MTVEPSTAAPVPDVTAVVLVGGRGTRISKVHPTIPKPLIPVNGRPFLWWLTALLASHGLRSFVYSSGYMADQIAAWCADASFPQLDRRSRPESQPLGTGGGLLNCLDEVSTDWILVANGDGVCLSGLDELLSLRGKRDVDGGLIGLLAEDTSRFGSLDVDADARLIAFREKVPGRGYINSGLYLFSRTALLKIRREGMSSLERDLIPDLIAKGMRLDTVLRDQAPFIDIGTPESLEGADRFVQNYLVSAEGRLPSERGIDVSLPSP